MSVDDDPDGNGEEVDRIGAGCFDGDLFVFLVGEDDMEPDLIGEEEDVIEGEIQLFLRSAFSDFSYPS